MKQTIYSVRQGVWGADRPRTLFFATMDAAQDFYREHDYTDRPERLRVDDTEARELVNRTRAELMR